MECFILRVEHTAQEMKWLRGKRQKKRLFLNDKVVRELFLECQLLEFFNVRWH